MKGTNSIRKRRKKGEQVQELTPFVFVCQEYRQVLMNILKML